MKFSLKTSEIQKKEEAVNEFSLIEKVKFWKWNN